MYFIFCVCQTHTPKGKRNPDQFAKGELNGRVSTGYGRRVLDVGLQEQGLQ